MSDIPVTVEETPHTDPVTEPAGVTEKVKPARSEAQLQVLARARQRAIEVRREAAAIRHKEKALAAAEKIDIKKRVESEYSKLVERPASETMEPTTPKSNAPEESPEPPPKRKKKRVVVVHEDSASSDEEIEVHLPRQKATPKQDILPNPFDRQFIPTYR